VILKNEPKVSVIIPVYNVEKYLKKCIDSVLIQNYSNIEVILVDDASTDGSYKICTEYVACDERIKVLQNKENRGLSATRNRGLDIMSGEYVLFLDSDDWLPPEAIRSEVKIALQENVLLVVFKMGYSTDGLHYVDYNPIRKPYIHLDTEALIWNFFSGRKIPIESSACNKLYHYSLWDSLRFREGIVHEDYDLMIELLPRIKDAVFLNSFGYIQYLRQGSIIRSEFQPKRMESIKIALKALEMIKEQYGTNNRIYPFVVLGLEQRGVALLELIGEDDVSGKKWSEEIRQILDIMKQYQMDFVKHRFCYLKEYVRIQKLYRRKMSLFDGSL